MAHENNNRIYVACGHCLGSGLLPLTGVYLETLLLVRQLCRDGGYIVANKVAAQFGCQPTALNNRLAELRNHGLLTCEVYGRERRYRPAKLAKR